MAYIGIKAFPEHVYLVVGNNCAGVNFCRRFWTAVFYRNTISSVVF